ncbi:MAG: hypothetical protein BWX84_02528 [Verrucomicrobia bacterium ADurb.Bin118]|nr:MAG: hypothetical protein BWX84_02528 [Verrucomicrobia bacterium ADurb.Bin118]
MSRQNEHGVVPAQHVKQPVVIIAAGKFPAAQRMMLEDKHRRFRSDLFQILLQPEKGFFAHGGTRVLQGGGHQTDKMSAAPVERVSGRMTQFPQRLETRPPSVVVVAELGIDGQFAILPIRQVFLPPTVAAAELVEVARGQHKVRAGHTEIEWRELDLSQPTNPGNGGPARRHRRVQVADLDEREIPKQLGGAPRVFNLAATCQPQTRQEN